MIPPVAGSSWFWPRVSKIIFDDAKVSIWPGTELQPIGPNLYIFTTNKSYSALTVNFIVRYILPLLTDPLLNGSFLNVQNRLALIRSISSGI